MFKNFSEAISFIKSHQIEMIDLKFCDLLGRWHHVTISDSEFTSALFSSGVGFDGSSVGFKSVKSGDMALIPDLLTGFLDPFWDKPTISFICHIVEADTKLHFQLDPREILRRSENYMINTGIADRSVWGPEFEFYIFNSISIANDNHTSAYRVDSQEAFWNSYDSGKGSQIPLHGGYHAIPPRDQLFNLRNKISFIIKSAGINIKYHHHEVGSPGQCEIETPLMGSMASADASMIIKYIVRMTAIAEGKTATFLPKPLFGEAGSGMHFHQQLFLDENNMFFDENNQNHLSDSALFYIGGLLTHAPSVLAFTNPSTNSYRRLVPGFEAPVNCFFSSGNRSAAIRVPRYATEPHKVRFEFRPPDASCNPYLAISAMLMAGLDGIQNRIDPTKSGFGPIDEDIFGWNDERRSKIKGLPSTLTESLDALKSDHDYLLKGEVFSSEFIQTWINQKMKEVQELESRPHPFEIQQYYDF